ncbi:MAG: translocation/assembly module TamB domain-containing protein, partial [bacterium]
KRGIPLALDVGNVILMDVGATYTDVPGGLKLALDDVVITLTKGRFDPKSRRNISIRAGTGDLQWRIFPKGRKVVIESLDSEIVYSPEEILISSLSLATGPLKLDLTGRVPRDRADDLTGNLLLKVALEKLPWLLPGSSGEVSLLGGVGGSIASPSFRGQLSSSDLRLAGRQLEGLEADVYLDAQSCDISNAKVRYAGQTLDVGLSFQFTAGVPYLLEVNTAGYPLDRLLGEIRGARLPLTGGVSARATVSGRLAGGASDITMEGDLDLPIGTESRRTVGFALNGQYKDGGLEELVLEAGSGGMEVAVKGSLKAAGPELTLTLESPDLKELEDLPGLRNIGGSIRVVSEIRGSWKEPAAAVDVVVREPAWGRFRGDLLQAHADLDAGSLSLPMISLKTGSCTILGQGYAPLRPDGGRPWFAGEITGGRTEDLLAAVNVRQLVKGYVRGKIDLSRSRTGLEGTFEVTLEDGQVAAETFEKIAASGTLTEGGLTAESLSIVKDGRHLEGTGSLRREGFEVRMASVDPVLLEGVRYLQLLRVRFTGDAALDARVSGELTGRNVEIDAELDWDQITFAGRPWRGGRGTFQIRDWNLRARADLLDGEFSAVAQTRLGGEFPFSGTIVTPATAGRDAINDLIGLKIPADAFSGDLKIEADAEGYLTNLNRTRVTGTVSSPQFQIKGISFSTRSAVPFQYFPETGISFTDAALQSGNSLIGGSIRIAPDTSLEGAAEGSIDLQGFQLLRPTVDSFSGQAQVNVKIAGSLREPLLNGSIGLRAAQCVAHIPFDLPVKGLNGDLEIVGNRLSIGAVQGETNGGSLKMEGDIIMSRFNPVQGFLGWKGEGVTIHYPEGLTTVNRADISLRFSEGRGVVRGSISMDEGRFTRKVDIDNLIALIGESRQVAAEDSRREEAGRGGEWLTLDIEMETATPVDVDLKLLRGQARGDLHLQGTAARPVLAGRMEMIEGIIIYRGHEFAVTTGSVGFFNPVKIEPRFDFSARTTVTGIDGEGTVKDYIVELVATGVPEKFKLDLISSPPLSEVDIVALLTWGAVGERAFASRSGLSAAEATLLLTRELKGKIETGVEQITGFDRFIINPSAVTSTGERTTRIQVDKRLSEKVFLTYSTPILTSEEQEVLLKYRVSDSFSLIGEQRGERNIGLDLDFQFELR